jgi:hypothetical protein
MHNTCIRLAEGRNSMPGTGFSDRACGLFQVNRTRRTHIRKVEHVRFIGGVEIQIPIKSPGYRGMIQEVSDRRAGRLLVNSFPGAIPSEIIAGNAGTNSDFESRLPADLVADCLKQLAPIACCRRDSNLGFKNTVLPRTRAGRTQKLAGHDV